jgi:hypothetical protein
MFAHVSRDRTARSGVALVMGCRSWREQHRGRFRCERPPVASACAPALRGAFKCARESLLVQLETPLPTVAAADRSGARGRHERSSSIPAPAQAAAATALLRKLSTSSRRTRPRQSGSPGIRGEKRGLGTTRGGGPAASRRARPWC